MDKAKILKELDRYLTNNSFSFCLFFISMIDYFLALFFEAHLTTLMTL